MGVLILAEALTGLLEAHCPACWKRIDSLIKHTHTVQVGFGKGSELVAICKAQGVCLGLT